MTPRSRALAAAIKAGRKRYSTGKRCKRGHLSPRWTANSMCIACKYAVEKTPKYKIHHHSYGASPRGREVNRTYNATAKGQERWRRYNSSAKGLESLRRHDAKRRGDPVKLRHINRLRRIRYRRKRDALTEN